MTDKLALLHSRDSTLGVKMMAVPGTLRAEELMALGVALEFLARDIPAKVRGSTGQQQTINMVTAACEKLGSEMHAGMPLETLRQKCLETAAWMLYLAGFAERVHQAQGAVRS